MPGRRQARQVGECRAAAHEHLRLQQQIGAGAFDELNKGKLVGERDLLGSDRLLDPHRMGRAAFDAGIVGRDHASCSRHHADADDRAAAEHIVDAVVLMHAEAGEAGEFEKWRVAVEQQVDAFARRQLAALAEFRVGARRGLAHFPFERAKFTDQLQDARRGWRGSHRSRRSRSSESRACGQLLPSVARLAADLGGHEAHGTAVEVKSRVIRL